MVICKVRLTDQLVGHSGSVCCPPFPTAFLLCFRQQMPGARWGFACGLVGAGESLCLLHQDIDAGGQYCARQEDLSAARARGTQAPPGSCRASACARSKSKGTWSPAQLSASIMIPSKILVYHHPPNGTSTEVYRPTRRRKKSLGDLFRDGYRVRSGPPAPEKEEPQNRWQSLVSCCQLCASWGKVSPDPGPYPPISHIPGGCPGKKCPPYGLDCVECPVDR